MLANAAAALPRLGTNLCLGRRPLRRDDCRSPIGINSYTGDSSTPITVPAPPADNRYGTRQAVDGYFPPGSCDGGPMIKTVIGSFDSADDADRATRDLRSIGFADADINLVVSNVRQGHGETELP